MNLPTLSAVERWVTVVCLLGCLAVDIWTFFHRQSEFLTGVSFTILVVLIAVFVPVKRDAASKSPE